MLRLLSMKHLRRWQVEKSQRLDEAALSKEGFERLTNLGCSRAVDALSAMQRDQSTHLVCQLQLVREIQQ